MAHYLCVKLSLLFALFGTPLAAKFKFGHWLNFQQEFLFEDRTNGTAFEAQPAGCDGFSGDLHFQQRMDHFSESDQRTWMQRYQVNGAHFDNSSASPAVFLHIGGEGRISSSFLCRSDILLLQMARQHRALVVQLEHRFFGPNTTAQFGELTAQNLRLLTIGQAMADISAFIPGFNRLHNLPNARWVAFGSSYAGTIAAWLRAEYPQLTAGSVASSAPIWPKVDFWEYMAVMEKAIHRTSALCHQKWKEAFSTVNELVKVDDGRKLLAKFFNVSADEMFEVPSELVGHWAYLVQYNRCPSICLKTTCESLTRDSNKPHLAKFARAFLQLKGDSSGDSSQSAMMRAWTWMTCNEFGWYQTTDRENNLFANVSPLQVSFQECVDRFGPEYGAEFVERQVAKTWKKYGDGCTFQATNVIFTNGEFDPWSAMSVNPECRSEEQRGRDTAQHLVAVTTPGASHCADMFVRPNQPEMELTQQSVRREVAYYLGSADGSA